MDEARSIWVFGYGSLVHAGDLARQLGRPVTPGDGWTRAHLAGYRRAWNAALDNTRTAPGDKFYLRPDGSRPAGTVSFIGLLSDPAAEVNGIAFRAQAGELAALDRRERRYQRREVTGSVAAQPIGAGDRVYTYVTRADAVARHDASRRRGTDRHHRRYVDRVHESFRELGPADWAEYQSTTDPLPSPVEELVLHRAAEL